MVTIAAQAPHYWKDVIQNNKVGCNMCSALDVVDVVDVTNFSFELVIFRLQQ